MAQFHSADRGPYVPGKPPDAAPLRVLLVGLDAEECTRMQEWLRLPHLRLSATDVENAPALARELLPGVMVVEARVEARTQVIESVLSERRALEMGVLLLLDPNEGAPPAAAGSRPLHLRRPFNRARLLAAVEQAALSWRTPAAMQWQERQQREEVETLLDLALDLTSQLDLPDLLQHFTDAARHLTGAAYVALFQHAGGEGQALRLGALSGAPREAFDGFGLPRQTALLAPTFAGERLVRCDDVQHHPHYGREAPHHGLPSGHLPVRSYLAAPVVSREGKVLGALLFGHGEPRVFTRRSERLAEAIAAQTATAIDHFRHLARPAHRAPESPVTRAQQPASDGTRSVLEHFDLGEAVQAPPPRQAAPPVHPDAEASLAPPRPPANPARPAPPRRH